MKLEWSIICLAHSNLAFEAQYLRMLCHYAKQKVMAIVATPRLLLSVGALTKWYSQNASVPVFNTSNANAEISGGRGTLCRLVLGGVVPDNAELEGKHVSVKTLDTILACVAAAATIAGGALHIMMIGPSLKPANFPMHLLLFTDTLFIVAGLAQIFWALPMIKVWGLRWHYIGILGTAALSISLLFTRLPDEITSTALIDTNPMALLTEISQFLYIGATTIIARRTYLNQKGKMRSLRLNRGD